jgi:putative sensory transduction regulator
VAPGRWAVILEGRIRHAIPVTVEMGTRTCTLTAFLMRGPRGPAAHALHRVLLRKNRDLLYARLCLDADDDVVLVARLPLRALTPEAIDETLGELLTVSESSFESLVHLGYPGVFEPLRTPVP